MITKENAKQYKELLEAFIAGKTLQIYMPYDEVWKDIAPDFSFSSTVEHYRVKPTILYTRRAVCKFQEDYWLHTLYNLPGHVTPEEFVKNNQDVFIRWVDNEWVGTEV